MNDMTKEQHLLDDIEDAQEALRSYKRAERGVIVLGSLCLALIALGVYVGIEGTIHHKDTGDWATVFICVGNMGIIIICIFCGVVISDSLTKDDPRVKLRKAQRAYRDYLMRQTG